MPRANHRHPTIRAEAHRIIVAIQQPSFLVARQHPLRMQIPALHDLLLHALTQRIAGNDAADHFAWRILLRDIRPRDFCKRFNIF